MTIPKTLPNTDSRSDQLFFGAFPRLFGHPCQIMSKQFGRVGLSAHTPRPDSPENYRDCGVSAAIPNAASLWEMSLPMPEGPYGYLERNLV